MNPGAIICSLPTWDYAMAGYVISSLPQEARNALTKSEMLIVQMLLYLCGLHARQSGRQTLYATPSQSYLGKWADRSDRTARRVLTRLCDLGLVSSRRRAPTHNRCQTNLYQLGGQLLALVINITWPKSAMKSVPDKSGRQRPKERSRHRASDSSGVIERYHDSHKPFKPFEWSDKEPANRLTQEEARHGFASIYAKLGKSAGGSSSRTE